MQVNVIYLFILNGTLCPSAWIGSCVLQPALLTAYPNLVISLDNADRVPSYRTLRFGFRVTMKLLYGNPVARSISLRLLLVHALSSLLQINCSIRAMLSAAPAERFRSPPLVRLDRPVAAIFLIKRYKAHFFHFLEGNSAII